MATLYKFLSNKRLHMADYRNRNSKGTQSGSFQSLSTQRKRSSRHFSRNWDSSRLQRVQNQTEVCACARFESVLLASSTPGVVNISTRRFDTTSVSVTRSWELYEKELSLFFFSLAEQQRWIIWSLLRQFFGHIVIINWSTHPDQCPESIYTDTWTIEQEPASKDLRRVPL